MRKIEPPGLFDISNPVVFLAMIITGFAISECGKAKGWW